MRQDHACVVGDRDPPGFECGKDGEGVGESAPASELAPCVQYRSHNGHNYG